MKNNAEDKKNLESLVVHLDGKAFKYYPYNFMEDMLPTEKEK